MENTATTSKQVGSHVVWTSVLSLIAYGAAMEGSVYLMAMLARSRRDAQDAVIESGLGNAMLWLVIEIMLFGLIHLVMILGSGSVAFPVVRRVVSSLGAGVVTFFVSAGLNALIAQVGKGSPAGDPVSFFGSVVVAGAATWCCDRVVRRTIAAPVTAHSS